MISLNIPLPEMVTLVSMALVTDSFSLDEASTCCRSRTSAGVKLVVKATVSTYSLNRKCRNSYLRTLFTLAAFFSNSYWSLGQLHNFIIYAENWSVKFNNIRRYMAHYLKVSSTSLCRSWFKSKVMKVKI